MTIFKLAVILALAAVPSQGKPRAPRPGADELLLKALAGPATSYAALERVQVFLPDKKPKAVKVGVAARPGGPVRREVFPPKKKSASLVSVVEREKPETALARLRALYSISVSTGGVVAKRKTWKLELRLKSGVLRRVLWVDRDSGLLLKRETYRDDGSLRRRERIVKLSLPGPADFTEAPASGPWSPDGFVFAGEAGGVRRFTNGLESYEIRLAGGKPVVTGDLAEDDAARVLETAGR